MKLQICVLFILVKCVSLIELYIEMLYNSA